GGPQRRQQQAGQLRDRGDVHGEVPFPVRGGELLDAAVDEDAGGVHESGEPAGQLEGGDRGGGGRMVGELRDERLGRRQTVRELGERRLIPSSEEQVVVVGERLGGGAADPSVRAGDEHGGAVVA